jgi:hypothetical protein
VYAIEPVELKRGDPVRVHCSYDNDTGAIVTWGESSLEEMCFAGVYRYPAFGGTYGIVCGD